MSSSDDSSGDSANSDSDWDTASDDNNSSDVADGEEAEFNDIDGLLPEVGEVGTYVELDGAESDDDRNFYGDGSGSDTSDERVHTRHQVIDPINANQDDSRLPLSSIDEIGEQPQPAHRGSRNRPLASSELDTVRQIQALEDRIQRDVSPGIARLLTAGAGYGSISNHGQQSSDGHEDWFYNCIRSILPARLSSTSKYTPLPAASSIRVISLHPGRNDDPLSATFNTLDLDNATIEYEAISYRWGPPILSKQPIFLSGQYVHINDSLKAILIRLRQRNCSRVVWADALCINQADMTERRQQVAMMQRIYSQASRVIIYLQGDNPHTNLCFKAVKDVTSAWITFRKTKDSRHSLHRIYDGVVGNLEMSRIAQIFENCYWTRLWVVQEIVSSHLAVVHWNGEVISWTLVGLATTLIRTNKRLWNIFTTTKASASARAGMMNAYVMYRLPSARFRSSSMSFLDLLRLTRRFNVTEPLDRIYATLGLPSQQTGPERHFITPDYRLLRQGLYTRVFYWVVTTHETPLEILSAVRHTTLLFPDFPTWIPEWHVDPIRSIGASHRKGFKFDASAGWPSKPMLQVSWKLHQRSLTLEGFLLGTITSSQQIFSGPFSEYRNHRARQRNRFKQEVATWVNEHVLGGEEGRLMLSLTLTAEQDWYGSIIRGKSALDQHVRCFATWAGQEYGTMNLLSGAPPQQAGDNARQYGQMVRTVSRGRKLFAMTGGRVGLGPEILGQEDIVCLLLGGPVPYVLRPLRNGMYYFVGECYVPGCMFGEVIAQSRVPTSTMRLRQFVLK